MSELKRIILKHPSYVNTGVITDSNTLFIEDSQRSAVIYETVGDMYKVLDGSHALDLVYNPFSKNNLVLGVGGIPTVVQPLGAVRFIYSKKLKMLCVAIPRNASCSILKAALEADGHIGDAAKVNDWTLWFTGNVKNGKCNISSNLNILASLHSIFRGYKKFYVTRDEDERWKSTKDFLWRNRNIIRSYSNKDLPRDMFEGELKFLSGILSKHPVYHESIMMSQKGIFKAVQRFVPDVLDTFEKVDINNLDSWFKENFGVELSHINTAQHD